MFDKDIDSRLSCWHQHRQNLDSSNDPFHDVWDFWKSAPYTPYNNKVDPYYKQSWPTPWSIIVDNKYDDFTLAVMIAWTIKLTNKFKNSKIEIKVFVDNHRSKQYNLVYVDNQCVINYRDSGPVLIEEVPDTLLLENIIDLDDIK